MRRNPYPLALMAACCLQAQAEPGNCATSADGCAASLLEEVVVTGRRAPQIMLQASETIGLITEQQLARSTASGLADVMRDMPGVQIADSGQPGLKRIRIRGEESRRTAILIDGQEITDHWEVGTPLSLHPAMVERIEVVRGSGSVLYGSRALSGVVNFITRKGGEQPLQLDLSGGWNSATRGQDWFASAFGEIEGTGYRVALAGSDHSERDTPDGRIENTAFDNRGIYAWAGRDFGAHRLELAYDDYQSATDVFVEEAVRTSFPLTDFSIDVPQRDRDRIALSHQWTDVTPRLESIRFNAQRQRNDRRFDTFSASLLPGARPVQTERWVFSDASLEHDEMLAQFDWRPSAQHLLVSGLQIGEERVRQLRHVEARINGIDAAAEDINDRASIATTALFAQDHWQASERTAIVLGARHYHVEGELERSNRAGLQPFSHGDSQLIGSIGLTHELADERVLRASLSQGYVYPSLLQFATGAYAGSRFVNPNADLDAERSWSAEAGLRMQHAGWLLDAGVFRSTSRDYIDHVFCAVDNACLSLRDKIYMNIGESTAQGFEAYAVREAGRLALRPYLNLTWMKRQNSYDSFTTDKSGVPAVAVTLGVQREWPLQRLDGDAWFDLALRGETASDREEPSSSGIPVSDDNDSWLTWNLSAGASLGPARRIRVVIELENLANARYSTSAENLLAPGRSISTRIDVSLE
jgi:hemoglobin/transferrin/lactoferrin receptor protein